MLKRYWPKSFSAFYRTKIQLSKNERDQIKYIVYNEKEKDNVVTTFGKPNILDFPSLIHLKDKIQKIINPLNLSLTNNWAQLYYADNYHVAHNHPLSNYSGIIYIDSKGKDGTLFFDQSGDVHHEKFEKSTLVLFPSYMLHQTQYQKVNNERIILAFNCVFNSL